MDNEKIRQFQRSEVSLPGILRVAETDQEQVQFSSSLASSNNEFSINITVVDIGFGGVGVESKAFIPRNLHGTIEVMHTNGDSTGEGPTRLILAHEVSAKRCRQISREPAYQVGLAFGSITAEFRQLLDEFFRAQDRADESANAGLNRGAGRSECGGSDHA